MTTSFKFYLDAGLTNPLSGNLSFDQNSDGSTGPVDKVLYLGSTTSSRKIQATSNPGTDAIVVSIADVNPGSGHDAGEIKLATTAGGLSSATGGASLTLPATINSTAANAQAVWIRMTATYLTVGTSTDLSLTTNAVTES